MPEYLVAIIASAVLGWGSFTWRRAEHAVLMAAEAQDSSDKLELKLAEAYLTKAEFNLQIDRLLVGLERLELKLDNLNSQGAAGLEYRRMTERLHSAEKYGESV